MLFATTTWITLLALYLVLAGQLAAPELAAGAAAAAIATAFATAIHRTTRRPMHLAAPWPRLVARTLLALPLDSARVARTLLATLRHRPTPTAGAESPQPFHPGPNHPRPNHPRHAARRAIVTLCASLAPNGYVTAIGSQTLTLHQLAPTPPKPDPEWPV